MTCVCMQKERERPSERKSSGKSCSQPHGLAAILGHCSDAAFAKARTSRSRSIGPYASYSSLATTSKCVRAL
eukprot:940740-Pyramimonas_sp.AAC.2